MADYNDFNAPYVIIDIGSSTIKCGFSGESCPRYVIPNVYAIENSCTDYNEFQAEKFYYYGEEAFQNSATAKLFYPQRLNKVDYNSRIKFFSEERIEGILTHVFKLIGNKQQLNNVFVIDSLFYPLNFRKCLAKLLFDSFSVAGIRIEPQEVMTLYSTSKKSGLIVESGESNTAVVPIYEGYVVNCGVEYNNLAGEELNKMFLKTYKNEFDYYGVNLQYEMAKTIKEKYSEVVMNSNDIGKNEEKFDEFELPDGNTINIGDERYKIPELMFNPLNQGIDKLGVHQMINKSISKCDSNIKQSLYNHIILGGGNSMLKNYGERVKKEVEIEQKANYYTKSSDKPPKIDVEYGNDTKYSAWIGASGICSLRIIQNKWLSRNDIDDVQDYEGENNSKKNRDALEQRYIYL